MTQIARSDQNSEFIYKTKLTDGRYFTITPNVNKTNNEYIISVISDPIYSNRLPVLLRQRIVNFTIFSVKDDVYLKTEINHEDTQRIRSLISSTPLNCYNLLFAQFEETSYNG